MAVFTGAGVAIATPFDENYNIDYESFGKFIDFQIENKTDAIIVCGTSGEASTLSHEEHIAAIRYCVNRVNKRVLVIVGTGSIAQILHLTSQSRRRMQGQTQRL